MPGQRRRSRKGSISRPACSIRAMFLAALFPMWLASPATAASLRGSDQPPLQAQGQTQAQGPWRGLDVPRYTNGTDFQVEADEDEYELYFRSSDNIRAIFDFYRNYLQKQGFRVARTQTKQHGFKADMVRGQGGPDNTVELDAKLKDGRYKVEIEFDE